MKELFVDGLNFIKTNILLKRQSRNPISYKISQTHVNYLITLVDKYPTWSIKLLLSAMKKRFNNFNISQGHLSKVIRDNNITRKRTRIRHFPETRYGEPIDFKIEMKNFYKITDRYSIKIISIDETSIHAEMTSNYSRCDLGKRCVKKTTDNKVFKKFTLVCAMTSKRIIEWKLYEKGGMNAVRMVSFIEEI